LHDDGVACLVIEQVGDVGAVIYTGAVGCQDVVAEFKV